MSWTLVTGGAIGLGAEIALLLAKHGKDVIIHYKDSKDEANGVLKKCQELGVKAEIIQGNFSSCEGIKDFLDRYKRAYLSTSCLVNNVGSYFLKPLLETEIDNWYEIFHTNFFSSVFITKHLLNDIMEAEGAIVNIGIAGLSGYRADVYSGAYNSAKTALLSYTRSLAKELAKHNVSCNMVSPGYMENAVDMPDDMYRLPMKRPAYFNEVASVVVDLLDRKNRYITGQNIEVAGGVRL